MELSHLYFLKNFNQFSEKGLHPGQLSMIRLLMKNPGLSQREIARRLHVKPPTVTVGIRRLEKNEFLYKKTDSEDQRITRIYLTEKGVEVYDEIQKIMNENEQLLFKDFSETEICLMHRFFIQMIHNIKDTMPDDINEKSCMDMYEKGKYE